jgi:hypothetical protein
MTRSPSESKKQWFSTAPPGYSALSLPSFICGRQREGQGRV